MFDNAPLARLSSPCSFVFLALNFILVLMWLRGRKTDSWLSHLELCHLEKVSLSEPQFPHLWNWRKDIHWLYWPLDRVIVGLRVERTLFFLFWGGRLYGSLKLAVSSSFSKGLDHFKVVWRNFFLRLVSPHLLWCACYYCPPKWQTQVYLAVLYIAVYFWFGACFINWMWGKREEMGLTLP